MIWFLNLFNKKTGKVENDKDLEIEIKLNKDFDDCLELLKLMPGYDKALEQLTERNEDGHKRD